MLDITPNNPSGQIDLQYDHCKWPDQERFPLNNSDLGRKVGHVLEQDLLESSSCIIITGFTSLARIIEWLGTDKFSNLKQIRILLGNDPILRKRTKYPFNFLPIELKEYWLNKGTSLYLGSSVLNVINKLEKGQMSIRYKDRAHAKIYVCDNYALLGSSNFSKSGLEQQLEANIRESKDGEYDNLKRLAELFYYEGESYNKQLINLLKELLADVTWEESLARAIAEILEGRWFADHNEFINRLHNKKFWPSQYTGLIEAINILIDKGNVLIADPTGSGKTKMCAATMVSFIYWLWQNGEKFRSNLLLISPPVVSNNWKSEFVDLDFLNTTYRSLGMLSHTTDNNLKDIVKELKIANVLAIDEAHNLLNPLSNRSRKIAQNEASYNILITATPVNKQLNDLVRIIELLDIDNLSEKDFEHFKEVKEKRKSNPSKEDIELLKGFIDQFLVRRTKEELNDMIEKDSDQYRNKVGNKCRFPKVKDRTYSTKETKQDKKIVDEINEHAKQLKGLNYLTKFDPPFYIKQNLKDQEVYLRQRLNGARHLSIYMIRSRLRSSKVALLEYLLGTDYVKREYSFESSKKDTGDVINTIESLIGKLPERSSELNEDLFEEWLKNKELYDQACKEELKIYRKIVELAEQLSQKREEGKVAQIISILQNNNICIAFDSNLITLDFLNKLLRERSEAIIAYIATGSNSAIVEKVLRVCAHGTTAKNVVIFCSDMMSEGVNLQGASSLILLDLPSVIRLVEQRIGRIDRMDTDHDSIDVFWPNDSEQYSLKGDRRLIETSSFVDATLGGNFSIPVELRNKHFSKVNTITDIQQQLKEYKGDIGWEGSHNFFKPIQQLKEKFISEDLYKLISGVSAQVKSRASFYQAKSDWCFICTRGSADQSPRWLFLEMDQKPLTDFIDISNALARRLPFADKERLPWDQDKLNYFLRKFREYEWLMLPYKKQRSLEVSLFILKKYRERRNLSNELKNSIQQNIALFNITNRDEVIDYYSLANLWLEILQPELEKLRNRRINRRRALNLNALKEHWKSVKLNEKLLQNILNRCETTDTIDNRIAACIVGICKT